MSLHTTFRIGGLADVFALPRSLDELTGLYRFCLEEQISFFILGGGANILVSDLGIRGIVIDLTLLDAVEAEGTLITALGGTPVSRISEFAFERGLAGTEFLYSMPGSVGGSIWMNARCYEHSVSDILEFVDVLDARGAVGRREVRGEDFGYKVSPFQKSRDVIMRGGFRMHPGENRAIRENMERVRFDREKKGHFLYPSAGSVFKNNRSFGAPTGKLIDSLGLKSYAIGGAQVSPLHGNIIINRGSARAAEVLELIRFLERQVEEHFGFRLEREVLLIGRWEEEDDSHRWTE